MILISTLCIYHLSIFKFDNWLNNFNPGMWVRLYVVLDGYGKRCHVISLVMGEPPLQIREFFKGICWADIVSTGWRTGGFISLLRGFQKFLGNIFGDFDGFSYGLSFSHQTRYIVRCCQINTFRQLLNVETKYFFHNTNLMIRYRQH